MSDFRTDFYNYFMTLAGTTEMLGHQLCLAWQTIGSFFESGHRHIPLDAVVHFSGLADTDVVHVMMHCNQGGYIEVWLKTVCKDCGEEWGAVRLDQGDWVRGLPCPHCEGGLDTHSFVFTYTGEPFEWRVLPGMDIDLSRFLPSKKFRRSL
jgi:hypothetical protein